MNWFSPRRALASALLVAAFLAVTGSAFASAKAQPSGLPVTFTLPSGWFQTATASGDNFNATGPGGVQLALQSGGTFPGGLPFAQFLHTETTAAQKHYKSEDPRASVSGGKVSLPSGPAVLIRAIVHHGGAPTAIWLYSFLHNGVTYHFTFFAPGSSLGSGGSSASALAKSVHFK
jgi:hypothetical protein